MLPRESNIGRDGKKLTDFKLKKRKLGTVTEFIEQNYKHFNAKTVVNAANEYIKLLEGNGKMFMSLAGAMSTAELGISLAEMIRQDNIHGISCTGANLEEDIFMLVAHDAYMNLPNYRDLTPNDEKRLMDKHINRVTDVGIPEKEAMKPIEDLIIELWKNTTEPKFPHEYLYELLLSGKLEQYYQIDPNDSWMLAAAEKNLPIVVPGWEDSTLGNVFAALCMKNEVDITAIKGGIQYMMFLADWYSKESKNHDLGFFQIGGGIAGDFSICVVPLLMQDMDEKDTKLWSYFCQISDAVTSYGGYSGATPNEKITWGKIGPKTPAFVIESDATIVAPLIFAQVLGW